jgi:hypothetical protein
MTKLFRAIAVAFAVLLPFALSAQDSPRKFKEKSPTWALSDVITVTETALNDYQTYAQSPDGIKDGLPPLATADFDFKTVVDTKGGFSINLLIFTIGATHEKQQTNELDFQYMPHVQQKLEFFTLEGGHKAPVTLYDELLNTLKESATEVKKASEATATGDTKLDLCQMSLAISFGVTTDVQGGIKAPIQLVTISATLDHSRNNVQQVKLVFKIKDPANKSCVPPKP